LDLLRSRGHDLRLAQLVERIANRLIDRELRRVLAQALHLARNARRDQEQVLPHVDERLAHVSERCSAIDQFAAPARKLCFMEDALRLSLARLLFDELFVAFDLLGLETIDLALFKRRKLRRFLLSGDILVKTVAMRLRDFMIKSDFRRGESLSRKKCVTLRRPQGRSRRRTPTFCAPICARIAPRARSSILGNVNTPGASSNGALPPPSAAIRAQISRECAFALLTSLSRLCEQPLALLVAALISPHGQRHDDCIRDLSSRLIEAIRTDRMNPEAHPRESSLAFTLCVGQCQSSGPLADGAPPRPSAAMHSTRRPFRRYQDEARAGAGARRVTLKRRLAQAHPRALVVLAQGRKGVKNRTHAPKSQKSLCHLCCAFSRRCSLPLDLFTPQLPIFA